MLSAKQIRFVSEYILDSNGAAAAVRAGYAPNSARVTASKLLSKANVKTLLQEKQGVVAKELQITRQQALQGLLDGIEMARTQGNPGVVVRGWTEVGKMLGFFAPEVHQVEMSVGSAKLMDSYRAMSDQELQAIIDGTCTTV